MFLVMLPSRKKLIGKLREIAEKWCKLSALNALANHKCALNVLTHICKWVLCLYLSKISELSHLRLNFKRKISGISLETLFLVNLGHKIDVWKIGRLLKFVFLVKF